MARTKASVGSKVSSGKSSKARCNVAPPSSNVSSAGSADRGSKNYSGGNPVCPRETPNWQKPITNFFVHKDVPTELVDDTENIASSSSRQKRNVIESDSEDEKEPPKNTELDESIILEELTGEECHKIDEYYSKNGAKGKGVGKKTRGKENDNNNVAAEKNNIPEKRNSTKRELDVSSDDLENISKKVKVK